MIKRGLIAGLAILLVGFGLNYLGQFIFPGLALEYQNTNLFRSWDDPIMAAYFAYPFVLGIALSYLWGQIKVKSPIKFAITCFIAATIPGMFVSWTSMQVSVGMILSWTVSGFIQAWLAGFVFTKVR